MNRCIVLVAITANWAPAAASRSSPWPSTGWMRSHRSDSIQSSSCWKDNESMTISG